MNIEKITVIGSGIMGTGIAHVCAAGGFSVFMQDVSEDILEKSILVIEKNLQKGVDLGKS